MIGQNTNESSFSQIELSPKRKTQMAFHRIVKELDMVKSSSIPLDLDLYSPKQERFS
mgnify:CR=1 FL=1